MYYKKYLVEFFIMTLVGILFNPMNILAYRIEDLYPSKTLLYGGLLMASNMIWSHQIVHYLNMGHFDIDKFLIGVVLSYLISRYLLRYQFNIKDKDWLERMISHHSTAITTSKKIYNRTKDSKIKKLSKEIIDVQEKEIKLMKSYLSDKPLNNS